MRDIYSIHQNNGTAHVYSHFTAATTTTTNPNEKKPTSPTPSHHHHHHHHHPRRDHPRSERKVRSKSRRESFQPESEMRRRRKETIQEEEEDEGVVMDEEKDDIEEPQSQPQSPSQEQEDQPFFQSPPSSPLPTTIPRPYPPHYADEYEPPSPTNESEEPQTQKPQSQDKGIPSLSDSVPEEPASGKRMSVDEDAYPIMKSSRTIRVSYTPLTYILQITLIILYLHTLLTGPWQHSFPVFFNLTNLLFHTFTLIAHTFHFTGLERYCIIYGTWVFWIGWVEAVSIFGKKNVSMLFMHPTTTLFWILMMDRRDAWGIVVWEHLTRLSAPTPQQELMLGMTPLTIYRLWTHLGVGSAWWLTFLAFATLDGQLLSVLSFRSTLHVCFLNVMAGSFLTCWWSFWTFQYRGVVWRREMKEGAVIWWSEGLWGGECV